METIIGYVTCKLNHYVEEHSDSHPILENEMSHSAISRATIHTVTDEIIHQVYPKLQQLIESNPESLKYDDLLSKILTVMVQDEQGVIEEIQRFLNERGVVFEEGDIMLIPSFESSIYIVDDSVVIPYSVFIPEHNNEDDSMGNIPMTSVPRDFPPRYWSEIGDTRIPYWNPAFRRDLDADNFLLTSPDARDEQRLVVPFLVDSDIYYFVDSVVYNPNTLEEAMLRILRRITTPGQIFNHATEDIYGLDLDYVILV